MSTDLPLPDAEARAVSARLMEVLRERIDAAGGCLPFDAFMEAALYEPGRVATTAEVAATIAYLVSEEASGVSGQSVKVSMGGIS